MNWKSISDLVRREAQVYIFMIVALVIPLTKEYLPHSMALWVLSGILCVKQKKWELRKQIVFLFFPFLFYLIHAVGLIYSSDFDNGLFDLEMKLSILLLPFIAFFISDKVLLNHRLILKLFILGNFIASVICLIIAFKNSIYIDDLGNIIFNSSHWPTYIKNISFIKLINQRYSNFSYSFLSIFHHPSYFSAYILFSIAIIVYLLRSGAKGKYGYYFLVIYFTIFIWLLGSRAAFITFFICFITFILILVLKYRKYWLGVTIFLLGILLSIVIFSKTPIKKNFNETISLINTQELSQDVDIRLWLWKSGLEVFQENFWFGVGTGDIDDALHQKYIKNNIKLAVEHNYNAHNQYLDTALKLGIIGLILLLFWIFYTLYITAKKKQFLFFYFMLIFAVNFMFEVMLNSIAGVGFFVFFYSLLYAKYNIKEKELN